MVYQQFTVYDKLFNCVVESNFSDMSIRKNTY